MRRTIVFLAVVGLIVGLAGVMPAPAGTPACQVTATTAARSCSFIATKKFVNTLIVGRGYVSVHRPGSTVIAYWFCPDDARYCFGGKSPRGAVRPGDRVRLTVNIGFGRIQTGLR